MRLPKGFQANLTEIAVSFDYSEPKKFRVLAPVSQKSRNVFGPRGKFSN